MFVRGLNRPPYEYLENVTLDLFGFEIKQKKKLDLENESFAPKESDDGAVVVTAAVGQSYGTYVDLDGTVRTEAELVTKYRDMSGHPEIEMAIDEIVNEAMDVEGEDIVKINLTKTNLPDRVKKAIEEEFNYCLKLLGFSMYGYDIFRRWYIDGRINYHCITDKDAEGGQTGIKELRYIDPRKIRKIREVTKKKAQGKNGPINQGGSADVLINKTVNEYYLYNEKGFGNSVKPTQQNSQGMKIARDSIIQVTSGLSDVNNTIVLSYLHKAIRGLNQLRTLEDAAVIYRLSRAPERRVWYIDVGNLPKVKAEQYLREVMVRHKNKVVYDASTGEIRDDRKFMTMLEDFWLPRREGGTGTQVTTLPGGQNLGQMDDVVYFQKRLYRSLNVPITRLDAENMMTLGRATEISRDEVKFSKFITRLRTRFSLLFTEFLERQLILKKIMTYDEWLEIAQDIRYEFSKDNYFAELKDNEILSNRLDMLDRIQSYIGRFFSEQWVKKNILKQTDEDIEEMQNEIEDEMLMQETVPDPADQSSDSADQPQQPNQQAPDGAKQQ